MFFEGALLMVHSSFGPIRDFFRKKRYYGGCEHVDGAETLAIDRAKELFKAKFANVQPHSGASANAAVFLALLEPGDTFLGMALDQGGHLTHGAKVALSGKWLKSFHYDVNKETGLIDYDEVEALAIEHKPKLIIAGASAYPRIIDWKKFRDISDKVGAYFLVDMAHYSGLIAGKQYPSPIEHAHIVTSTTHKTLRGARSAMILTNDETIIKKINSAVFPGLQGGPLMHVMAAKAVTFGIMYGAGPHKISEQVTKDGGKLSVEQARKVIKDYFGTF